MAVTRNVVLYVLVIVEALAKITGPKKTPQKVMKKLAPVVLPTSPGGESLAISLA